MLMFGLLYGMPFAINAMYMTESFIGTGLLVMAGAYFICGPIPALFIRDRLYDPQKAD